MNTFWTNQTRHKENKGQKQGPSRHKEPTKSPGEAKEKTPTTTVDENAGGSGHTASRALLLRQEGLRIVLGIK